MLKYWFTLFLAGMIFMVNSQTITVEGPVSGVWDVDKVEVIDDIIVEAGQTLIIQPGIFIEFQGFYSLTVEGTIKAIGTSEENIQFIVSDTTGFSIDTIPDGGWNGIDFENNLTEDSSLFVHCKFLYAKAIGDLPPYNSGGAISVNGSNNLRIEHCDFTANKAVSNGGGIYLDSSNILLKDNYFVENSAGLNQEPWGYGGGICSDYSMPHIIGNKFSNNISTGVGGGLAIRFIEGKIDNNVFVSNYSALGGAIGILHMNKNILTHCNNLMYYNMAEFFGGGIANINASPTWVNATIVYNNAMYGGGYYCKDSISPNVYNSIIWSNFAYSGFGKQVYLFEPYSQSDFYYSVIEGGIEDFGGSGGYGGFYGDYVEMLETDPVFNFDIAGPYSLDPSSPCINSGTPDTSGLNLPLSDIVGAPRVWDGQIDRGAYELFTESIKEEVYKKSSLRILSLSPNPASDKIHIEFEIRQGQSIQLLITDQSGKIIYSGFYEDLDNGSHVRKIYLEKKNRPIRSGLYVVTIRNRYGIDSVKFLVNL